MFKCLKRLRLAKSEFTDDKRCDHTKEEDVFRQRDDSMIALFGKKVKYFQQQLLGLYFVPVVVMFVQQVQ